jgi:hypothetical protein
MRFGSRYDLRGTFQDTPYPSMTVRLPVNTLDGDAPHPMAKNHHQVRQTRTEKAFETSPGPPQKPNQNVTMKLLPSIGPVLRARYSSGS